VSAAPSLVPHERLTIAAVWCDTPLGGWACEIGPLMLGLYQDMHGVWPVHVYEREGVRLGIEPHSEARAAPGRRRAQQRLVVLYVKADSLESAKDEAVWAAAQWLFGAAWPLECR